MTEQLRLQGLPQVPSFSQLDGDGKSVDLDGITVKVCSLDALRAMKGASERARDRDDLEALDALQDE